jgi:hypothetical protein
MAIDYTKLLQKLDPSDNGKDAIRFRKGIIDAVNSNGTVDVGVSGVVVPGVQVLAGATVTAGAQVWIHTWNGALYVLGRPATTTAEVTGPITRVATTVATAVSSNFTAEAVVMTVTAPLVSGRTYRVTMDARFAAATAGNDVFTRIRLGNTTAGATIQEGGMDLDYQIQNSRGQTLTYGVEYTAGSTGNQAFALTAQMDSGTNGRLEATANKPSYLYVDYVRG